MQGEINRTLDKSLFLIDTTDENFILIDAESAIAKSANKFSEFKKDGDTGIRVDVLGVRDSRDFTFIMRECELAGGVFTRLKWEVVNAAAEAGTKARIKIEVLHGNKSITHKPARGPARLIDVVGVHEELLSCALESGFDFPAGDLLVIRVEIEVMVASGTAGDVALIRMHHDPTSEANQAIVEINI